MSLMLLIPCPYCGAERPELEFRNGGVILLIVYQQMDQSGSRAGIAG